MTEAQREREAVVRMIRKEAFRALERTNSFNAHVGNVLRARLFAISESISRGKHLKSAATAIHSDDTDAGGTGQPSTHKASVRGSEGE